MVKYNRMTIIEAERVATGVAVFCLVNGRVTIGKKGNYFACIRVVLRYVATIVPVLPPLRRWHQRHFASHLFGQFALKC